MTHFMYKLDWAIGSPDIWPNITLDASVRCFWMRMRRMDSPALIGVALIPCIEDLNRTSRLNERELLLPDWSPDVGRFLSSGLNCSTGSSGVLSPLAFGLEINSHQLSLFFRSFDVDCICTIGCLGSQAYWLQILTLLSLPSLVNQFLIINVYRYIFLSWNLYTEVCTFWFWWFQPCKLELPIHWWRIPRECLLLYFFLFHFSK